MRLQCTILEPSPNTREIRGHLKVDDRVYVLAGSTELSQNNLPVKVHIQISPQEGGPPFHIQYQLQPQSSGHALTAKLSQGQKFIQVEAYTTARHQDELNVHLKVGCDISQRVMKSKYAIFLSFADKHV